MIFEKHDNAEKIGEAIGYGAAYFVFTTVLFFALTLSHKLPSSWNYTNVALITVAIALLGAFIGRLLQ